MEHSPAVEYQSSQVSLFMAGITKDLEDHVGTQSAKYNFNFEQEKPFRGPDRDYEWLEVSHFSKSEATGKKPRMNMQQQYDRKSTADTSFHSFQQESTVLSARGLANTSIFSNEASQAQVLASRQSSVYSVTPYQAQQICPPVALPQRFAVASKSDFLDGPSCIPEERESSHSPCQDSAEVYYGRESLAETPCLEGSVQSPVMMPVSSPFSAQSPSQPRQIPISNLRSADAQVRAVNPLTHSGLGQYHNTELVTRLQGLRVSQGGQDFSHLEPQPAILNTEEQELEDLAELDGDGPQETQRLKVYGTAQHFTNISALDGQKPSFPAAASYHPQSGFMHNQKDQ